MLQHGFPRGVHRKRLVGLLLESRLGDGNSRLSATAATTRPLLPPRTPRRPLQQRQILIILLANIFHQFRPRHQRRLTQRRKRLRVRTRIVNRNLNRHAPQIRARVALDGVRFLGMWMALVVEPELVVEPNRIHHQRVSLPMPIPRRIRIVGMLRVVDRLNLA